MDRHIDDSWFLRSSMKVLSIVQSQENVFDEERSVPGNEMENLPRVKVMEEGPRQVRMQGRVVGITQAPHETITGSNLWSF